MLDERLQPSLLDRLTDDTPGTITERDASNSINIARLRKIILRDLTWLFNTSNMEADHDLEVFPNVAQSVLNYGISDLSGSTNTQNRAQEIQQTVRKAIETFEPRIRRETIEVTMQKQEAGTLISFDIRAEHWAEPVPVDLYLRTALDVTSGEITVSRQG
ncbi:type VI secretion system baseplate subunit TssE [Roseibium algae]|uniref:Type VI secretion system baseplate subunit TssE n=1 Tax=Roseibium algae TaxID=3123038 RepID=A0ABU8TE86_9HYPH